MKKKVGTILYLDWKQKTAVDKILVVDKKTTVDQFPVKIKADNYLPCVWSVNKLINVMFCTS